MRNVTFVFKEGHMACHIINRGLEKVSGLKNFFLSFILFLPSDFHNEICPWIYFTSLPRPFITTEPATDLMVERAPQFKQVRSGWQRLSSLGTLDTTLPYGPSVSLHFNSLISELLSTSKYGAKAAQNLLESHLREPSKWQPLCLLVLPNAWRACSHVPERARMEKNKDSATRVLPTPNYTRKPSASFCF